MEEEKDNRQKNDFSKGPIWKNILAMAIPVTIAQAVLLLYNLVDRIYLGHIKGDGDLALMGVGIVFPIVSIVGAFTLLFAGGGAPLMSIARGGKDHKKASKLLNNSFALLVGTSVVLMIIFFAFMHPILYALGASENTYNTAADYLKIYLLGTIAIMISTGMNLFINAQGFGKIGMCTVCIGAVLNIVLDPVFIFAFNLGVKGAAWATVISQFASALWVMIFLTGKKVEYPLKLADMKIEDYNMIKSILGLGLSGFIMSVTNSLTQMTCNATLAKWGGDLYVGSMTILNSVREIFNLAANGITEGAKPVLGFNFGAGLYDRVKKGIKISSTMVVAYMFGAWALVNYFPDVFVGLFTNDPELIAVATPSLKLFFAGFFMMGFMFCGQSTFVSLGYSKQSVFFSLLRKVVIVVPLTLVLPHFMGVNGVFVAEPISNILGGIASFTCMICTVMPVLSGRDKMKR